MMNIPGNLIRGAGSVVGGTMSAVASVAGRRASNDMSSGEIVVKEKSVLTIKETPVKDALTTSNLSVLTGFLTKKNEQGMWQKRYCCLVPHMFLYYFESDVADSPRGIIDLEYFTDLDIQNENVLKISTPTGVTSRSFFFQIDDPLVMSQWMASLHRDRYMVIRDERDAYQQLQDQFSGQMDFTSKMIEEYSAEKERLVQDISKGQKLLENLVNSLKSVFQVLSANDEAEGKIPEVDKTNLDEMAVLLVKKISDMKSSFENQLKSEQDATQKERDLSDMKIEELEKQLSAETHARRLLETQLIQDKRESETRLREALAQIEKSNQSYQVVWSLKSSLDEKLSVTNEQKKVLIKEVKTLRKKVEDVNNSNEEFRTVNGNLENAISELQKQLDSQKTRFETLLTEAIANSTSSVTATGDQGAPAEDDNLTTTADLVQNALKASSVAKHNKGSASLDLENDLSDMKSQTEDSPHQSRASRHGSVVDPTSTSILPPPPLPVDLDGNVIEWDHETREQMLQMDWLSPEQRALLQDRQKEDLPFADSSSDHSLHLSFGRKRSIVQMTTNLFHLDKSDKHHLAEGGAEGGASVAASTGSSSADKQDHEDSKISFRRLSAMFHSSTSQSHATPEKSEAATSATQQPPSSPHTMATKVENTAPVSPSPSPGGDLETSLGDERDRRSSSAAPIPTCYRCGGTVEGPKYSTCKCDIPQMTPLVEESAIDQFKGLFSKGKNAAKKAGSAMTSSLLKGRSEENQHLSDSQHPLTPSLALPAAPPAYPEAISSPRSPPASTSSPSERTKQTSNLLSLDEPAYPLPPLVITTEEVSSSLSPPPSSSATAAESATEISSLTGST